MESIELHSSYCSILNILPVAPVNETSQVITNLISFETSVMNLNYSSHSRRTVAFIIVYILTYLVYILLRMIFRNSFV